MKYQNKQDGKTYERTFVVIQNDKGLVQIVGITRSHLKAIGLLYDFAQELIDDYPGPFQKREKDFEPSVSPMEMGDDDTINVRVRYEPDGETLLQLLWQDEEVKEVDPHVGNSTK